MSVVPPSLPGMRILHTSDWHLGRSLHGVDLLDHQASYLDHLVDVARDSRPDAVLVAGDVYDRAVPPVPAVEVLADALRRLTEHTTVVLTPGNHDSAIRLGFGAHLFTERVRVHCRVSEIGRAVPLPDASGGLAGLVYPLPYLDPDMVRGALSENRDEPLGRSHEAVVTAAVGRVHADLEARREAAGSRLPAVVMAHAFVVGGTASESERDIRVGGVDSVPSGVFRAVSPRAAADYVALGHLHGPQRVASSAPGAPALRYAGSPLAYSFSEQSHSKSTALVDVGADGVVSVELLPAPVPRRLTDVQATLEELRGRAFDRFADDWVRVTVTDDVRPPDVYAAVVNRFPHALVVQHRSASRGSTKSRVLVDRAVDPLVVAEQFVEEVGGRRATPDEVAVLRSAYEDALTTDRSA